MPDELESSRNALLEEAKDAQKSAYAPYSKFKVGAAVRAGSGRTYKGCNVENASFGLSMCAERVAIFNAVAGGETKIAELALFTNGSPPSSPCGACRQVLLQFGRTATVIMGNDQGEFTLSNIHALLAMPFNFDP